jgi:hypothetical protein
MDPVAGLLAILSLPSDNPHLVIETFRKRVGTKNGHRAPDREAADLIIACQNDTRPVLERVFAAPRCMLKGRSPM